VIAINLKNRFRLVIFSMLVLLVSIAVIVTVGIRHTKLHIQESNGMDDLVVNLYQIQILNSEYLTTPSDRVKQQWMSKYDQIKRMLIRQTSMPDDVKDALEGLQQTFVQLTSLRDVAPGMGTSSKRLGKQLATTLNLELQRVIDWASDISRETKGRILTHLMFVGVLMLSIIMFVAIATITIMHVTARRIFSSVNGLKEAAVEIASGTLGLQVEHVGNDEISSLATAINRMSLDLKGSYQNLHEQTVQLETEIVERQMIHEALQKKTADLEKEIVERTRIQEEHARLQEQLLQSQKMEAIGLLAGGIAHDFNNILSVIMGYGEMLVRNLPEGKAHDHVDQILKASERAAELTRGLLAFSRKQTFNLERTDINQLTADNIKFLKRVIGEDIKLVTTYPPTPLFILLDRGQIQQVLMNLATNARDAMPSGGMLTISITTEILDENVIVRHGYGSPGEHAVIRVTDTGTGMGRDTAERIFEPFFTTKEKGKGTGLGLSIIHGIIAQHNGFISCSSEPGVGTTFSIYLPISEETGQQRAFSAANRERKSQGGGETILLAEDDRILMEMTTTLFESCGYRVLGARDGMEAVKIFKEKCDEIDIVILDAIMPNMNGKQALDEISSLRPGVKACFISGYANQIINGKFVVDGSVPFISKPVMPEKLLEKVREILDAA
jgi:signal transduction histidine kinase